MVVSRKQLTSFIRKIGNLFYKVFLSLVIQNLCKVNVKNMLIFYIKKNFVEYIEFFNYFSEKEFYYFYNKYFFQKCSIKRFAIFFYKKSYINLIHTK